MIALYVSTNETRKIQDKAVELENEKAKKELTENKLIVYYDLMLGLNDLKKLYISCNIGDYNIETPQRMYFSVDWIKNVAMVSSDKNIKSDID